MKKNSYVSVWNQGLIRKHGKITLILISAWGKAVFKKKLSNIPHPRKTFAETKICLVAETLHKIEIHHLSVYLSSFAMLCENTQNRKQQNKHRGLYAIQFYHTPTPHAKLLYMKNALSDTIICHVCTITSQHDAPFSDK